MRKNDDGPGTSPHLEKTIRARQFIPLTLIALTDANEATLAARPDFSHGAH